MKKIWDTVLPHDVRQKKQLLIKIKVMKIRVNTGNSKVINERLFIDLIKLNSLKKKQKENVNDGNNIIHPILGRMVSYEGEFIRVAK